MTIHTLARLAGLMGSSAVGLGAYTAHRTYPAGKEALLKPLAETGNKYHLIHAVALLGAQRAQYPAITASLMIAGTFLFSGACYYHAFTGNNRFGKLAPVGGTLLILSWLSFML